MIKKRGVNLPRVLYNHKFLALLGLIIIFLISFPLAKNISQRYKIDQEIKELEKEIIEIESKNKDLKELVTYLESDQFVEEQARLNLGLKKIGEEAVIIKEQAEEINPETGEVVKRSDDNLTADSSVTNPRRWWKYFFIRPIN